MTASSESTQDEEGVTEHLEELADGCGCAEIWEHLSERRDD